MVSKEDILKLIVEKSGKTEEDIKKLINEKINELSGLISEEGALHIIANDLNVRIDLDKPKKDINLVKIKEIKESRTYVNFAGKIVKKYDIITFSNENNLEGKIQSILVGDETGVIRVVFWNDKVELSETLNEGDIVKLINVYTRENQDRIEVSFSAFSDLEVNPDDIKSIDVKEFLPEVVEKKIEELKEGERNVKISGVIVDFDIPRFYYGCPQCFKKLQNKDESVCPIHGKVEAIKIPIVNLVIDDGTSSLSVVAFRINAEKLLNLKNTQIFELLDDIEKYRIYTKRIIGKSITVVGNVSINNLSGELQLTINNIENSELNSINFEDIFENAESNGVNKESKEEKDEKEVKKNEVKREEKETKGNNDEDLDIDLEEIDVEDL